MKRRLIQGFGVLLLLVAGYFVAGEIRDWFVTYYADNYLPRKTATVADEHPSQVCLTLGADPRTTLAAQWRTNTAVADGVVQLQEKGSAAPMITEIAATRSILSDPMLKNDPENARYAAVLGGLKPGTTYSYRVGSKQKDQWSDLAEFTTAPEGAKDYSFVYMGDPQLGLESWGKLMHACDAKFPAAAFYLIAGDLVDRGKYRDEWDTFFEAAKGIFDRRPIVPVLGNHDYSSRPNPDNYLQIFTLPENGPKDFPVERDYAYRYGNALFIVLDANQDAKRQAAWLEDQLKNTDATWKFVCYHQPAYSSSGNRDNPEVRSIWGALFDKYHVDIAFQGHDHAYLRTPPMKAEKKAASFADGTVYVITVSGTKYYKQAKHDYTEVGFTNTSTYQIIDIKTGAKNILTYTAYDLAGEVKDTFTIEK